MKKRAASAILAIVMVFTLVTSVSATGTASAESYDQHTVDIHEEIERALNGETDLAIDASSFASAELINSDGTTEDVEIYVTTRELPMTRSADNNETMYATTVVARAESVKTEVGNNVRDFVTGTLTLYWVDVFGPFNKFEGLTGSWVVANNPDTGRPATLSGRKVNLKGSGTADFAGSPERVTRTLSSNTFRVEKGALKDGWLSYSAESFVTINGSSTLRVWVETGLL